MQGPKVAVVVVSVFNTLNTIDCRVRGQVRGERMGVIFIYLFFFGRMLELELRYLQSGQGGECVAI